MTIEELIEKVKESRSETTRIVFEDEAGVLVMAIVVVQGKASTPRFLSVVHKWANRAEVMIDDQP